MDKSQAWSCINYCGACCKLDPEQRQEALLALSSDDQELYLSMVGEDGWCRHYDKKSRKCSIYDQRPSFCNAKKILDLFNVPEESFDHFAISCCKQQIRYLYGGRSKEMKSFIREISVKPSFK